MNRLNSQGCLTVRGRRSFVCEALAEEWVGIEELEDTLLVRYRHMYIREIDLPHPPDQSSGLAGGSGLTCKGMS